MNEGPWVLSNVEAARLDPRILLDLAIEAARAAGALLRAKLGTPLTIETKRSPSDLVTEGDRAAEALIAAAIRARYPDHRILAEEGTTGADASPYRWIIDPVDGTTNFAHGVPAFAVSIGVEHDGFLQAGVVYNPATEELFAAARAHGATLNGRPIQVSRVPKPKLALIGCGAIGFVHNGRFVQAARAFWSATHGCRTTGAAALDLCYVACGRFDLFCGPSLSPWDMAAGALIVREAGGRVTDFDGEPHRLERRDILASNGTLHPFGLRVTRGRLYGHRIPAMKLLLRLRKKLRTNKRGRGRRHGPAGHPAHGRRHDAAERHPLHRG